MTKAERAMASQSGQAMRTWTRVKLIGILVSLVVRLRRKSRGQIRWGSYM